MPIRLMTMLYVSIFILMAAVSAHGEEITLEWDIPDGAYDGVKIFQHTAQPDDVYDYTSPVADVPAGQTRVTLDIKGLPDEVLKYQWVARAYKADQLGDISNEVSYKVINIIPISPAELTGSFDFNESVINLTFVQPEDQYPINRWEIYYSVDNSDFIKLGSITDPDQLTLEVPFDAVKPGEKKTVTFRAISFRRSGVFSNDSNDFELVIDRSEVPPVKNLRLNFSIPVI